VLLPVGVRPLVVAEEPQPKQFTAAFHRQAETRNLDQVRAEPDDSEGRVGSVRPAGHSRRQRSARTYTGSVKASMTGTSVRTVSSKLNSVSVTASFRAPYRPW